MGKTEKRKAITIKHGFDGRFELGERVVADPLEPGKYVSQTVNVREGAIDHMASRGRLDPSQTEAGQRFRRLWEKASIGRSQGIDPSKEAVDGGGCADPISDDLVKASIDLSRAMRAVGLIGSDVLISVLEYGSIEKAASRWSQSTGLLKGRRAEGYITGTLVDALNGLVRHWRLEGIGKPILRPAAYRVNGIRHCIDDDIVASGPISVTGPATELEVGRFGDIVARQRRPTENQQAQISGNARNRR